MPILPSAPKVGQSEKKKPKRGGRKKGTLNKTTAVLKEAILIAAEAAGGKDGLVGYLKKQAIVSPASFLALLGKVLPLQVTGADGGPIKVAKVEWSIADPSTDDSAGV